MAADLSPEQQERLQGLLTNLSHPVAVKLLTAVERDRLSGRSGLPHETLVEFLRGRVVAGGGASFRTPTPQRLFCQPFEDLLYVGRMEAKETGRISRETLTPLWDWLLDEALGPEAQILEGALKTAILKEDEEKVAETLGELHRRAGPAILAAIEQAETEDAVADLQTRLGGAGALADAKEIATIVAYGPEIMDVQKRFPRPITHLGQEDIFDLRQFYASITSHADHIASHLLLILMGRMARPWDILRVVASLSEAEEGAGGSAVAALHESFGNDVRRFAAFFHIDAVELAEADDFVMRLDQFCELSAGLQAALGETSGGLAETLAAAKDEVGGAAERQLELALAALRGVFTLRRAGGFAGPVSLRPDIARQVSAAEEKTALAAAEILTGAKPYAEQLGVVAYAPLFDSAVELTSSYAQDLIDEIRAAEGPDRARARAIFDVAADILARLVGEDEADLMRRRGSVAAQAA